MGLDRGGGSESPAGTTVALVLDSGSDALFTPVNMVRKLSGGLDLEISREILLGAESVEL